MCIGVIRNNSFFSRQTRPGRGSNRSSATANVTLYCTWRPSGLTIGLHGQGYWPCSSPDNAIGPLCVCVCVCEDVCVYTITSCHRRWPCFRSCCSSRLEQSAIWCHCVAITVRLQATAEDVPLQPFIWSLTELRDTVAFIFFFFGVKCSQSFLDCMAL